MSVLKSMLRTVWAAPAAPAPASGEAGDPAGQALPGEEPASGETAMPAPAWHLLGRQAGVQELDYGDIARPGLQKLFARTPRRLLDIGCASGAVGAGLKKAKPGLWVWGCELNERAAQVAAGRLDRVTTRPRTEWTPEEVALLRDVDTVLLLDVLEHMVNPWDELAFLARHLPPQAQLIVSLPNVGHLSVLQELATGMFRYQPTGILDVTHLRFFTFTGMQSMFAETGFRVDATWVLSSTPDKGPARFPAQVAAGKVQVTVENEEEWKRLNAIQFGFRLRPDAPPAVPT